MMTQSTIHRPSMEASPSPSPPPPPTLPQGPLVQRYKTIWRVLLISNLALGAYMFAKARRKDAATDGKTAKNSSDQVAATIVTPPEEPLLPPLTENPKVLDPILEDQQRELFTWILEKKRREKPRDPKEKKQIDDEKAILKHFIRAKSIPTL